MADNGALKKALRESNAIGWLAFFILVTSIGAGIVIFDGGDEPLKDKANKTAESGLNYLK